MKTRSIKKVTKEYFTDFVSLIYPHVCAACGKTLIKAESAICTCCRYELPKTNFHLESDNPVSRMFWGKVNIHSASAFYFFNKGTRVQHLMHLLKYRSRTDVGLTLGKWLGITLKESPLFNGIAAIVPVPLHPKRLRIRGYNQAGLIADGVSKALGIPVLDKAIIRRTHTDTQTRKGRFSRWENVKTIFQLNDPVAVMGKHILLVDDVITTGSTIEACAHSLLEAEGTRVSIAALAYASRNN